MKNDPLAELRTLLRDLFAANAAGRDFARHARAHGYVDGYMRSLEVSGVAGRASLLAIVSEERTRAAGPALQEGDRGARFHERRAS
jgi:hypothetical protein